MWSFLEVGSWTFANPVLAPVLFSLFLSSSCSFPCTCSLPSLFKSHPKEMKLLIQPDWREPQCSFLELFLYIVLFPLALSLTSTAVFSENWFLGYSTQKNRTTTTTKNWSYLVGFFYIHLGPESPPKQKVRVLLQFTLPFFSIMNHMLHYILFNVWKQLLHFFFHFHLPPELFWFIELHHP